MTRKIVIAGAGVSGLTLAERLTASGEDVSVTVLEKEDSPGGLARTFERDGFLFDIGPHRFHTSDSAVSKYLLEILGNDHVTISRSSNVYMSGKYRSWPLTMKSVAGLPLPVLFRSFLDLFRRRSKGELSTFSDYVISKYGKNIYNYFFKGYTKKFTGCSADTLHIDWAEAGVNRAVIDKNVKADDLFSLLKSLLIPKPLSTMFYYPSFGGIQTFCDKQADRIQKNGGRIIYGCRALGVETANGKVSGVKTADMGVITADHVYWSAPVSILFPDAGFRFMDTLLCNIALSKEQENHYQWCYFGHKDILFSRLTVPRNFRADTVPEKADSLIVEITLNNPEHRSNPESLKDRLIQDLERVDALKPSDIKFMDWRIVPQTYPLYDLEYRKRLSELHLPEGLELTGRCGSFWYNNMDHSIGEALAISSGRTFSKDFWKQD
ncbi:MAG: FAD-dependent oxidoreductase [Candidatus Aegiribacteria sp.]|nr:FAD-dependent oxidoreductase [Candidatus Aegiribacteria sp.]